MQGTVARESFTALPAGGDELLARRQLRRQIARLEREHAGLFAEAFGRVEVAPPAPTRASAPRVLDLGQLERVRDELADRVAEARGALAARARVETSNRELLRALIADPARHRWLEVTRADIGEPGCGAWRSRPRLGPVGLLMGWWRVKVSSGCPLPGRLAAVER